VTRVCHRRGIVSLGIVAVVAAGLVIPAGTLAGGTARPGATVRGTGADSVMLGDRRISVPSGDHFSGSQFQVMTPNGAHVFVRSNSDLTVAPEDEIMGVGGGIFDLIAGRAVRVACGGCISVPATTDDATAIVGFTFSSLDPSDTDGAYDYYLFDAEGPHLITVGDGGLPNFKAMTADGSFVVVELSISLDPADTDDEDDLYRWTRATGEIELISPGALPPVFEHLSTDGSRVLFNTPENILGLDLGATGQRGIYEWLEGAVTIRGRGELASASPDGARVYTNTKVALDPLDDDEQVDAYLHDAGGFTVLSEPSQAYAALAAVKADGSSWIIGTVEPLTQDDTDATSDFYVVSHGARTLLSRGALDVTDLRMDADFASAIYITASPLAADDTDEWNDVYRWSAAAPDDPSLLSGQGTLGVSILAYAPDGSRAFMTSMGQLMPEDTDPFSDVYEHVDGELRLVVPGEQDFDIRAWTADLQRLVVEAGALTSEDTNGNVDDVYLSDADQTPPAPVIGSPALGLTGPDSAISFSTAAGDGVFFDCRVDDGAWEGCVSPYLVTDLSEGTHVLDVRAWDAAANAAEAGRSWQVDATPPAGTIWFDGNGYVARTFNLALNMPATDALAGLHKVQVSNDGLSWVTYWYVPRRAWSIPTGDGPKTVWLRWSDKVGNWSEAATTTVLLDTIAPTATAPRQSFPSGGTLAGGAVPVKLAWTGSDGGSGVQHYEVARATDGGGYSITPTSVTAPSLTTMLPTGHLYQFRIRAVDMAGNRGAWAYGPAFTVGGSSEATAAITYTGTWATATNTSYWGGKTKYASGAGAKATYTFTGRAVAWISVLGPTRGKAAIYINGAYVTTVDLYAPSAKFQVVAWSGKWSTSATRTLEVRVLGTMARPRIDIDGFTVTD